jgi:hypothetical protein
MAKPLQKGNKIIAKTLAAPYLYIDPKIAELLTEFGTSRICDAGHGQTHSSEAEPQFVAML